MAAPRFASVEDYLASLDMGRKRRRCGRSSISFLTEFPELEAKIAWNVPQIHREGAYVVGVSALKNHLAFSPWSTEVIDNDFRPRLEPEYVVRKNLFQIPVDWEVDRALVTDMVRARLAELG